MKDEFKRDRPPEHTEFLHSNTSSDRYPARSIPKIELLRKVIDKHPGIFTYVGTLAVLSEGKLYDYRGEEIKPRSPQS